MHPNPRLSTDAYYLIIAETVAQRATCARKKVGAVLVLSGNTLGSGYNGSLPGEPHCIDVGCLMEDGHCVRTVHAEANALTRAAKFGNRVDGATLYTTASPCWACFKLLVSAGIRRIVYKEFYRDDRIFDTAKRLGVELVSLSEKDVSSEKIPARASEQGA